MDVLDTAHELAETLLESEAFAAFEEAEIDFLNDDEAQALAERLEQERARWRALAVTDPAQARPAAARVRALETEARAHPVYRRYQAARRALDAFVGSVLDEISYMISGTTRQDVPCGKDAPTVSRQADGPAFVLARRLGQQLQVTDQYRRLVAAERAFLQDAGVQNWIEQLRAAEERLRRLDYRSPAEGHALRRQAEKLRELIAARPSHAAFLEARERFDRLMGLVLDTISLGLTGSRRVGAGCAASGGSCGCGSGLYLPSPARMRQLLSVSG